MRRLTFFLCAAFLLAFGALVGAYSVAANTENAGLPESFLIIETRSGAKIFRVELAQSQKEITTGLMFRKELAEDRGMLFAFGRPAPISMWMKNTFIPLDMIFIREDGRIANIEHNAAPHSLESRNSRGPITGVLEIGGGLSDKLGIAPGDLVRHEIFGTVTDADDAPPES